MRPYKLILSLLVSLSSITANAEPNTEDHARQNECEQKLAFAQQNKLILGLQTKTDGIHAMVYKGFMQAPYTTKLGMAVVIECAIAGPNKRLSKIIFRDEINNKAIAEYTYPELTVY